MNFFKRLFGYPEIEPSKLEVVEAPNEVAMETLVLDVQKVNISDSLEGFLCARAPYIHISSQPNIRRLYDILVRDDVNALRAEIDYVVNQIGIERTRLLWVELGSGNDNLIKDEKNQGKRVMNQQYKTDWFSAAVYLGAEKCIEFALEEGWASVSRGIRKFTPDDWEYFRDSMHERDSYRREEYSEKEKRRLSIYPHGVVPPHSSLRRECMERGTNLRLVKLVSATPDAWTNIEWSPSAKIGTVEWLKRLVCELHLMDCSEEKYTEWSTKEFPRDSRAATSMGSRYEIKNCGVSILDSNAIEQLLQVGWANIETIKGLQDWFNYKEIDISERYKDPIHPDTWQNRENRAPPNEEFAYIVERLELMNFLPPNIEATNKRVVAL